MKKDNECYFCKSKKCYSRIVSTEDNGKTYDEVACRKHATDLDKHSDEAAPQIMKLFISSTGELRRGESISRQLKEIEEMSDNTN